MTFPITKDGEYTTRSGLPVRIYATDGHDSHGGYVHGAVRIATACSHDAWAWEPAAWYSTGMYAGIGKGSAYDLIPKPKVRKLDAWYNVYLIGKGPRLGDEHLDKASADSASRSGDRIACIHIQRDVVEGEGLE